ncbi:hypothetical protein CBR_g34230 [Chara braunii]|uniref:G8 domain-containing protein n=1 Tax=Chara braunii TaxID=69332 RepID=A0A388JYG7_CHABU|nr:hypothetical protein CBR_g34230 [Chara braunii]|eukprot:GBG62859.1 hypothetical protein CBR_g34230 [Chara braunii]
MLRFEELHGPAPAMDPRRDKGEAGEARDEDEVVDVDDIVDEGTRVGPSGKDQAWGKGIVQEARGQQDHYFVGAHVLARTQAHNDAQEATVADVVWKVSYRVRSLSEVLATGKKCEVKLKPQLRAVMVLLLMCLVYQELDPGLSNVGPFLYNWVMDSWTKGGVSSGLILYVMHCRRERTASNVAFSTSCLGGVAKEWVMAEANAAGFEDIGERSKTLTLRQFLQKIKERFLDKTIVDKTFDELTTIGQKRRTSVDALSREVDRLLQVGYTTSVAQFKFINTTRKLNFSWPNAGAYMDTDGTLHDTPSTYVLAKSDILFPSECRDLPSPIYNAASICHRGVTFRSVKMTDISPSGLVPRLLNIRTVKDGATRDMQVPWSHEAYGFMLPTARSFNFTWVRLGRLDPSGFRISPSLRPSKNEFLMIISRQARVPDHFHVYTRGKEVKSLAQLPTPLDPHGSYFYDGTYSGPQNDTGLTILIAGDSDAHVQMVRHQCPDSGCPVDSGLFAFRAGILLWSDPATWLDPNAKTNGQMPQEGWDVLIPNGWTVMLDISPPGLGVLTIEGTLVFSERHDDLTLEARIIFINGGNLTIGTPENRFPKNATIKLTGPRSAQPLALTNDISFGSNRSRPAQQEDEIQIFVRDLMKEREEKRKRDEEEEKRLAKEEKEKRWELDMARRTEEMRLQLQAKIADKWKKQQEQAMEKAKVTSQAEDKATSPKISPKSKAVTKAKEKTKRSSKKKKMKTRVVESSSSLSDTEESTSTTEDSSDTEEEALRLVRLLREEKRKTKMKKRQIRKKTSKKNSTGTYERGECSKKSDTPTPPTKNRGLEPETPLTKGYKGISASCSQEGLVDYTLSVMKQYSGKKVSQLKEICEKHGIKPARKEDMVMELVKRQTELAYDGFFSTPLMKKTRSLKIDEDMEQADKTPTEPVKTTVTTRGKAKIKGTPRVTLRSAPPEEQEQTLIKGKDKVIEEEVKGVEKKEPQEKLMKDAMKVTKVTPEKPETSKKEPEKPAEQKEEPAKQEPAKEVEKPKIKEKVKMKLPFTYNGKRGEHLLLWIAEIQTYCSTIPVEPESQVAFTTSCLGEVAKEWVLSEANVVGFEDIGEWAKTLTLREFFQKIKEKFLDKTTADKAFDELTTISQKRWTTVDALSCEVDQLLQVPSLNLQDNQVLHIFSRALSEPIRGHLVAEAKSGARRLLPPQVCYGGLLPSAATSAMAHQVVAVLGNLDMHGLERTYTWSQLAKSAPEGSRILEIRDPVDWKVGDMIVVAPSRWDPDEAERAKIVAISGNRRVLTIDQGLRFPHMISKLTIPSNYTVEFIPEVLCVPCII